MCAQSVFNNARISGISIVVGENEINIDDELQYYNNDPQQLAKIKKSVGFVSRRIASEKTTAFNMCLQASRTLLEKMNLSPDDFDAIISVTQTPDYYMPGNAHLIHGAMGFGEKTAAFDYEFGCSGFVFGLFHAYSMINSGFKRVLLLTGDTLSKIIDVRNRADAPIFGDAGSACVVEYSENETKSWFILRSDGKGADIMRKPAGAYRNPSSEETKKEYKDENGNIRTQEDFYMNGFDTFSFTLTKQPPLLNDILELSGKNKDEIDYFIMHQANAYIVETIIKKAKIPLEKAPVGAFRKYANQSSASIPGVICSDLSDALNNNKKQVLMQGFGIGLSWAACCLELDNITILKPAVYTDWRD